MERTQGSPIIPYTPVRIRRPIGHVKRVINISWIARARNTATAIVVTHGRCFLLTQITTEKAVFCPFFRFLTTYTSKRDQA